jgi:ATP-dependent Clp protease ATP-binding subunit ClpA
VNATEETVDYLIDKGFDDKMGARPLQRIIDDEIKKPLSRMILFGDLQEGGRVEVTLKEGKLDIVYKKAIVTNQFKPKTEDAKTS